MSTPGFVFIVALALAVILFAVSEITDKTHPRLTVMSGVFCWLFAIIAFVLAIIYVVGHWLGPACAGFWGWMS